MGGGRGGGHLAASSARMTPFETGRNSAVLAPSRSQLLLPDMEVQEEEEAPRSEAAAAVAVVAAAVASWRTEASAYAASEATSVLLLTVRP